MMGADDKLDDVRQLLIATLAEKGMGFNELSRRINKNKAYIYQYLYHGSPKVLPEQTRLSIAQVLNIDETKLRSPLPDLPNIPLTSQKGWADTRRNNDLAFFQGPRDVPVFQAYVLRKGTSELMIEAIDSAHRPANLLNVPGAFCLVASGMQLSPRYRPGDMLFFHPFQPPLEGDGVAVQLRDGSKVLGILKAFDVDGDVVIETLNPPSTETYKPADYQAISREVGVSRR